MDLRARPNVVAGSVAGGLLTLVLVVGMAWQLYGGGISATDIPFWPGTDERAARVEGLPPIDCGAVRSMDPLQAANALLGRGYAITWLFEDGARGDVGVVEAPPQGAVVHGVVLSLTHAHRLHALVRIATPDVAVPKHAPFVVPAQACG